MLHARLSSKKILLTSQGNVEQSGILSFVTRVAT